MAPMENLDPASVEAQRTVVCEIFRSVLSGAPEAVTLGALLQAYDQTIVKYGICASDLAGIQIYRSLLQSGRQHVYPGVAGMRRRHRAAVDSALQPLHYDPENWQPDPCSKEPLKTELHDTTEKSDGEAKLASLRPPSGPLSQAPLVSRMRTPRPVPPAVRTVTPRSISPVLATSVDRGNWPQLGSAGAQTPGDIQFEGQPGPLPLDRLVSRTRSSSPMTYGPLVNPTSVPASHTGTAPASALLGSSRSRSCSPVAPHLVEMGMRVPPTSLATEEAGSDRAASLLRFGRSRSSSPVVPSPVESGTMVSGPAPASALLRFSRSRSRSPVAPLHAESGPLVVPATAPCQHVEWSRPLVVPNTVPRQHAEEPSAFFSRSVSRGRSSSPTPRLSDSRPRVAPTPVLLPGVGSGHERPSPTAPLQSPRGESPSGQPHRRPNSPPRGTATSAPTASMSVAAAGFHSPEGGGGHLGLLGAGSAPSFSGPEVSHVRRLGGSGALLRSSPRPPPPRAESVDTSATAALAGQQSPLWSFGGGAASRPTQRRLSFASAPLLGMSTPRVLDNATPANLETVHHPGPSAANLASSAGSGLLGGPLGHAARGGGWADGDDTVLPCSTVLLDASVISVDALPVAAPDSSASAGGVVHLNSLQPSVSDANAVLAEAFSYRRLLRSAARLWRMAALRSRMGRRTAGAQALTLLTWVIGIWCGVVVEADQLRQELADRTVEWGCQSLARLTRRALRAWCVVLAQRSDLRRRHDDVRRAFLGRRLRQWAEAVRRGAARARGMLRALVAEWRAAARRRREIRDVLVDRQRQSVMAARVEGFCWWRLMCRRWQAGRHLMTQASSHGRITHLTRAVALWHARARGRRMCRHWWDETAVASKRRARSAAIVVWRAKVVSSKLRRALVTKLIKRRSQHELKQSVAVWHARFASAGGKLRQVLRRHVRILAQRLLRLAHKAWCGVAQSALIEHVAVDRRRNLRLLQLTWAAIQAHAAERRLANTYKGWADLMWIRMLLRHGWTAWHAWLVGGGRVTMMRSEAQIIASWCWMRVSESCHGAEAIRYDSVERLTVVPGIPTLGQRVSELCVHRYGEEGSLQPGMAHMAATAAELLFSCAPFAVHPHRFHSWKWRLLALFARALLRRLFHGWLHTVRLLLVFRLQRDHRIVELALVLWRQTASRRRLCRAGYDQVSQFLVILRRRALVSRWHHRFRSRARLRRGVREFDVASRLRICQAALVSWRDARARHARELRLARVVATHNGLRVQGEAFRALATYWQQARQATLMVRLSGLFLRKCSLRCGIRGLRAHVCDQAARTAVVRIRVMRLRRLWIRRWWRRHQWHADLACRRAAATAWAKAKLCLCVYRCWAGHARQAGADRARASSHRRSRTRCAIASCIWHWRVRTHGRVVRRGVESLAGLAIRRRTRSRGLRWWRSSAAEAGAARLSARVAVSQRVAWVMTLWKQCVQESRASDVGRVAVIVLRRFQCVVGAWRREVLLSGLVRCGYKRLARRCSRLGLARFRLIVRRRRWLRAVLGAIYTKRNAALLALCARAWASLARRSVSRRGCAEVALVAVSERMGRHCLRAWQMGALCLAALASKARVVCRARSTSRAVRALKALTRSARIWQALRDAASRHSLRLLHILTRAWREFAGSHARVHRIAMSLSHELLIQRRLTVMRHWWARSETRRAFRTLLGVFRSKSVLRRLTVAFHNWCESAAQDRVLSVRLSSFAALVQTTMQRRGLRSLALWCVYSAEREESLSRAAENLGRWTLRHALARWSSVGKLRRNLESRALATASLHACQSRRRVFDLWARVWLMDQHWRSACATAELFQARQLGLRLLVAWALVVRAGAQLWARLTAAKQLLLGRSRSEAWRAWRLWIAERWLFGERKRHAASRLRRLSLNRGLGTWRSWVARLRYLEDGAVALYVKRCGLACAVCQTRIRRPRVRAHAALQRLTEASSAAFVWRTWSALGTDHRAREAKVKEARKRRESAELARCFHTFHTFVAALLSRRAEVLTRLTRTSAARWFGVWATVSRKAVDALLEFSRQRGQRTIGLIRSLLRCWVAYYLLRKSLQVLAGELRERRRHRQLRSRLLFWIRASAVGAWVRRGHARRRVSGLRAALVGWRRCAWCLRGQCQLSVIVGRAILTPALRGWRRAMLLRRGAHGLFLDALRAWRTCAASCVSRRGRAEVLRARRSLRRCREALSSWRFRLLRDQGVSFAVRVRRAAAARAWRRWRERVLGARVAAERRRILDSWRSRSRMLQGWFSWRQRALEARVAADRRLALWTLARRSRILWSLRIWHLRVREFRAFCEREQLCRNWVRRSQGARACTTWRVWALCRLRNAALAVGRRHGTWLVRRAVVAWRIELLCIARERLRGRRLIRTLLTAWLAGAVEGQILRTAEATTRISALRVAFSEWQEAILLALESGRQLVVASTRWEASCRRRAFCALRDHRCRQLHLRQILPEAESAVQRHIGAGALASWWHLVLVRRHVRERGAAVSATQAARARARRLGAWRRAATTSRQGATVHARLVSLRQLRRFREWRRAVAVSRLPALRAGLEAQVARDSMRFALRRLVGQHTELQAAMAQLAIRYPFVPERLQELLERGRQDRRDAMLRWRSWVSRRKWRLARHFALRRLLNDRAVCRALTVWDTFRASSILRAARLELVDGLCHVGTRRLQQGTLRIWCEITVSLKRDRLKQEFADRARRRQMLRDAWLRWTRIAGRAVTLKSVRRLVDEVVMVHLRHTAFHTWLRWLRWEVAARLATLRLAALQVRRRIIAALTGWLVVAKALAARETRHMLQADDLWRRRRQALCMAVAIAWRRAAAESGSVGRRRRAARAFACWQLYAQEQVLLRRYLHECSRANFQGCGSGRRRGGDLDDDSGQSMSVRPADFERLYGQMAAHRWEVTEVLSE